MTETTRPAADGTADLLHLVPALRRYVAALVADPHDQQDVVQETLTRMLATASRLSDGVAPGYAFAVARNLIYDRRRERTRFTAVAPRLADPRVPDEPDAQVLAREERTALAEALAALPPEHRDVLVAHAVDRTSLRALGGNGTPGALAAKLARARARLRVDYVLAFRGVHLPTPRCHPVLLALSAGDRRRQAALDAGAHLLTCPVCPDVSVPLLSRERALAGLLPSGALALAGNRPGAGTVARAAAATTAVAAVVAGLVAVAVLGPDSATPPAADTSTAVPRASGAPSAGADPCLDRLPPASGADASAGTQACMSDVEVVSVPANEGFWVRTADGSRAWVQLSVRSESDRRIRAGQRVTLKGTLVRHGADFPASVGVNAGEGAAELARQGLHVRVEPTDLRIQR